MMLGLVPLLWIVGYSMESGACIAAVGLGAVSDQNRRQAACNHPAVAGPDLVRELGRSFLMSGPAQVKWSITDRRPLDQSIDCSVAPVGPCDLSRISWTLGCGTDNISLSGSGNSGHAKTGESGPPVFWLLGEERNKTREDGGSFVGVPVAGLKLKRWPPASSASSQGDWFLRGPASSPSFWAPPCCVFYQEEASTATQSSTVTLSLLRSVVACGGPRPDPRTVCLPGPWPASQAQGLSDNGIFPTNPAVPASAAAR
jgi:hypothetical protein